MKLINQRDSADNSMIESRVPVARPIVERGSMTTDLHSLPLVNLIEIPFARKYTVLACLLSSILLGWLAIVVWPRTYVSYAELLFQVGRESVALDPSVTTGQTLLLQKSQEEDVNSALKILQSRRVLEMVIDRLGEVPILDGHLPGNRSAEITPSTLKRVKDSARDFVNSCILATGMRDKISNRELAVIRLSGNVKVEVPQKSTVVTIEATSKTPEMAQAIAQHMVDAFLELRSQTMQTRGSREFFVAQTEQANQRLIEAQERKRQFLETRKLVSIEARQDAMKEQMAAIEMDLLTIKRELEQALAKSKQLDTDIAQLDDITLAAEQEHTGATFATLRQRIYELELRELSESTKYTDGNKTLEATRKELAGARQILKDFQKSDHRDKNTVPNPLKQKLQEEMKLNDSNIAGLRSAIEQRRVQLSALGSEVAQVLQDAADLSQVDRDIEQFTSSLRLLRDKEEEARVIDEMRKGGVTSVSQFQPATFVERAIKPNKPLLMAGFVILGLISGVGLAYARELNSGAIRTSAQALQQLRVPVIGKVRYRASLNRRRAIVQRSRSSKDLIQISRSVLSELMIHPNFQKANQGGLTLGVIGVEPGSGASTVSMALAVTSSEDFQLSTVLVEADRIGRTISSEFKLNGAPGLAELALGKAETDDCLQPTTRQTLRIVSSSSEYTSDWHDAASCHAFADAITQIQKSSDLVIVDLPPASSPDKLVGLARHLDYVIVVLESGKTEIKPTNRLLRALEESDVNLVGIVLNKSRNFLPQSISQVLNANA